MVSVLKADEEPDKNSLQVIKAAWAIRDCAISEFLHDLTDHQEVPGRIAGQPQVVETGRNWVTISWPKPEIKDSTPVLAYKIEAWLVGAEGGAKWKELGVTPSNTLDAFNLQPGGEYLLRIRARNRYGWGEPLISDKPIVIGQLVDMPEIVKDMPALVRALDGTNVALTFFAKSATLPVFTWYKDGELLNFEKKPSEKYERTFDGRKVRLLIVSATADDAGHYVCEVKNEKGRVSSHGRLEVVADKKQWDAMEKLRNAANQESPDKPPEFAMHLRDRRVKVNFPVRLTCQATGFPEPKVQWFKDDARIFEDAFYCYRFSPL